MSCLTVDAMLARRTVEKGEWYPCKRANGMRVLFPNVQRVSVLSEGRDHCKGLVSQIQKSEATDMLYKVFNNQKIAVVFH